MQIFSASVFFRVALGMDTEKTTGRLQGFISLTHCKLHKNTVGEIMLETTKEG